LNEGTKTVSAASSRQILALILYYSCCFTHVQWCCWTCTWKLL